MRIKSYAKGGYTDAGIYGTEGATLNGPLILSRDPVNPMEAATKKYVDDKLTKGGFVTSNFSKGTLGVSTLPSYSGDLTSNAGSNIFNLPLVGITAGTHRKVKINSKGLVIAGNTLLESDIPALPWSKIVSGKPNTLAGWGISGVLLKSGGTLTGALSASGHPTQPLQPATLGYVRSKVSGDGNVLQVGDIISKPYKDTPLGFLRCNGGRAPISMYSELYTLIKENYKEVNIKGCGKPWKQQYDINTVGDSLGAWTTATTSLPGVLGLSQAVVTKNRVYLLGGNNGSGFVSTVYTTPINGDGTLGAWTTATSLPQALGNSQAIVTSNRVYLLGGNTGSGYVSTVYTAPINEDGTLGAWTTATTSLPGGLGLSQAVVTKNRVYLLGGRNASSGFVSTVYTAPINEDGTLGAWTTATSLPGALSISQAVVTKNRVYLIGGEVSLDSYVSTVYTAPINEDGTLGVWTTATSLPGVLGISQAIVTSNRVYLLGGQVSIGSGFVSTVYTTPINEDGTLGAWTTATSLPQALSVSQAIVTSSRVYLLGGHNSSVYTSTVYTATLSGGKNDYSEYYDGSNYTDLIKGKFDSISHPGNGKPWKQQYDINTVGDSLGAWTTATSLPGTLGYSQAVVTKNRVYLLGGHTGSNYLSTIYTAPINEDGTLGAWTTATTSLPGALNNSQAIVTKNRVYLLGGENSGGPISTIYTAPINEDGTLGAWTTATSLPGGSSYSQAVVTSNRVYLLGGYNGDRVSTVYTAHINEDGTLGAWATATSLPQALSHSQAIVTKNRVYLLGGGSTVYTAPINEDGTLGAWTTATSLPGGLSVSQAIVTSSRVYLLGGIGDNGWVSTVYTTPINGDGTLGAWTTATSLPQALGNSQAIVTSNRVYLLGGRNTSSWVSTVYTATLSGGKNDYSGYYDGSLKPIDRSTHFNLPMIPDNNEMGIYNYVKY